MPSPERIAVELIKDAVEANERAIPLNYVSLVSAKGGEVTLMDEVSGEEISLQPQVLVNAAGPWIDLVNGKMGRETPFISATKGSHVILDNPRLKKAIGDEEFFFENKDGRIVLIFPLLDKVMIGTSDLRIDHPDEAVITEEEIDYFFDMIGRVFPAIEVDRSQIVYTFSGVRPLERTEGGATGQISRNHTVKVLDSGELLNVPVISLVGGKWTSFRAFSEHAVDKIMELLGKNRIVSTWDLPIGGSKNYPEDQTQQERLLSGWVQQSGQSRTLVEGLFAWYGTKTSQVLDGFADQLMPLSTLPEMTRGELAWIMEGEDVLHLDDLILRRTTLAKLGKISPESLAEVAAICASILGWSADEKAAEIKRYQEKMLKNHRLQYAEYIPA
jgi:glycerol-3-phosphate dehydrogenase